jgi:hypothetical protein
VTRFGPRVTSTLAGRSRVVCGGTIAEDRGDQREQVIVADVQRGVTIATRATPSERWVPHGDATFRATFQTVDVVTGLMYRPLYYVGARRARSAQLVKAPRTAE